MKTRLKLWVKIFITVILLIVLIIFYTCFINNKGFVVNEIPLYENVDSSYNGLKIVQISDLNYGNSVKYNELKKIIDKVNLIKADIVLFTGDLIYKNSKKSNYELTSLLKDIDCNIGKYYITGDEDNNTSSKVLNDSNFESIDNSYKLVYLSEKPILIAGISTSSDKNKIDNKLNSSYEFLNNNKNIFSILIMHEPNNIDDIDYNKFNIIMAGHTHGGYIKLPLIGGVILPTNNYLYGKDYYKKKNTKIYISNGLGNDKINYRFLNKPSFNFYRIRKK